MMKSSLLTTDLDVITRNKGSLKKGYHLNVLKQPVVTMNVVLFFKKSSCLSSEVNQILMDLQAAGFIDYVVLRSIDTKYLKIVEKTSKRQKISLEQLSSIFYILICGLVTSSLIFVIELTFGKFIGTFELDVSVSLRRKK